MKVFLIVLLGLFYQTAYSLEFSSNSKRAILIELFTSQGCSSCPPAEKWLGNLKDHPKLWSDFVPIAWHVDYWDYIGWKDRFAKPEHAERQRFYRTNGNVNSVYTPGLLQNGSEWRSWFFRRSLKPSAFDVGELHVDYKNNQATIHFKPLDDKTKLIQFNVALLDADIEHKINAGENHGKTLEHDFVVRQHKYVVSRENKVTIPLAGIHAEHKALAAWVSDPDSYKVIQATGGWLKERP